MPDAVLRIEPLGFAWQPPDPFLMCVHHEDAYPAGNAHMGPAASLAGRDLGQDFAGKDGWRMYHGEAVPGFPAHPHRGFETVTIVRKGLVDHADSLGAAARYGHGDTQWLTAGRGIQHAEMFPLIDGEGPNPLELFQIWLNLPSADKLVDPHFTMLWRDRIPHVVERDDVGRTVEITVIAGAHGEARAPAPPPRSWAARPDSHVAIWTIALAPGARWTLPAAPAGINRSLFAFRGGALQVAGHPVPPRHGVDLVADLPVVIENGPEASELLLLQGRPISEPVAQHGPFVMTSPQEIRQAFADYQRTHFGGWPWPNTAPVHGRDQGRFARHVDGRVEHAE